MRGQLLAGSLIVLMLLAATGCQDIEGSFRPGNFGRSPLETAMINALTEKHGDLRESGPPRFLESMMTSRVENGMPADRVTKYGKDTKKLYAWFVYDNFSDDVLEIEWIYLSQNHSIHTFRSQTGKDFGRGTFILEQPDGGWPVGAYRVLIRGREVTATVDFDVIDGATVATPVLLPGGQVELPKPPGWHLTGWEYIQSKLDVTLHQPHGYHDARPLMGTSDLLYNWSKGEGQRGDFTVSIWRTDKTGKTIAGSTSRSTWEDPPPYLEPGKKVSMRVGRTYSADTGNHWGQTGLAIKWDIHDLPGPGYATAGKINFVSPDEKDAWNPDGKTSWHTFSGTVQAQANLPAGKPGDLRAIWIFLEGYGFKYIYEWRK